MPQISPLALDAHLRMACKIVVFSLVSLSLLIGLIAAFSLPIAWCRVALRHHTDKNLEGSSPLNEVPTQRYTSCRFVSPGSEIALREDGQSFDVLEWPKLAGTTVHCNFVPCEPHEAPTVLSKARKRTEFTLWALVFVSEPIWANDARDDAMFRDCYPRCTLCLSVMTSVTHHLICLYPYNNIFAAKIGDIPKKECVPVTDNFARRIQVCFLCQKRNLVHNC